MSVETLDFPVLNVPDLDILESGFGNGKPPTYQRTNHVEKYNQNMPTAGTGGQFCSMLDDIEHLSQHPPYFSEFPTHERMNFEFADILCDSYTDAARAEKRQLPSDFGYYQDTNYCANTNKGSMSRTCSMSSDENQLETIGDIQYNNCCTNESDLNQHSMKPFNVCNTANRMCNNSDVLCNSSDRVCNNVERLCSSNDRICNNPEQQLCSNTERTCTNTNRIYNVSPPGSPDNCRWRNKHPENWNSKDVLDWLFYTAEKCNLEFSKLHSENFQSISGSDLCKLSIEDFERIESVYGRMLYSLFKELRDGLSFTKPPDVTEYMDLDEVDVFDNAKRSQKTLYHMNSDPGLYPYNNNNVPEIPRYREEIKVERSPGPYDFHPGFRYGCGNQPLQPMHEFPHFPPPHHRMNPCSPPSSQFIRRFPSSMSQPPNRCSMHENVQAQPPPPIQRRRPGRPRIKSLPTDEEASREKKVKNQHLWEFIYEVLMNPMYNPQYVRWENQREGVFRFVQSEAVAQLWGSLKNNDNMTYEKLSRAMRHYYKRGILERVEGRRLVYKFSRVAMDRVREKRNSI
ncbi:ELF3 [Mytilus edulis]|uniref:K09429 n=1 Tax=Mytilus edulis TaxID=6550 RepID=A0A8S3PT50_MYTED|nr:ELF3 [Mytilus edulis]